MPRGVKQMGLEHPAISNATQTGYPSDIREVYGIDSLGNEVLIGDQILVLDDEFYLVEELISDSVEILENHGAEYKVAERR